MWVTRWARHCSTVAGADALRAVRTVPSDVRAGFIAQFAKELKRRRQEVELANQKDCEALAGEAEGTENAAMMLKAERMYLDVGKWDKLMNDLLEIEIGRCLVGSLQGEWETENKVASRRTRAPFGRVLLVHGPDVDVTARAIAMLVKTGNAASIKASSSTPNTTAAIAACAATALESVGLPESVVQVVTPLPGVDPHCHLEAVLAAGGHDLIIAAGGAGLQELMRKMAQAPVMHVGPMVVTMYIHADAEPVQVQRCVQNAVSCSKSPTSVDHVVVHVDYKKKLELLEMLHEEGVVVHADKAVRKIMPNAMELKKADWGKVWMGQRVGVRQVQAFEQAVMQINAHGSRHLDVVMTRREDLGHEFQEAVDSAMALVNTSPRLADAEGLGMGSGLGIAAGSFHRGPIALQDLLTTQYGVVSVGRTRPEGNSKFNPSVTFGKAPSLA
eukprot:TRINITY_DN2390_c0_g1_i1.p1 TRINITY_DN2390_c0_g1~~TRINITY_DN2390_c0_g1_i1.p1  ORF type:complete len:444 (+),score=131.22 TRINITY_DN2390_c0_g1_i1:58-1389(+)